MQEQFTTNFTKTDYGILQYNANYKANIEVSLDFDSHFYYE